MQAYHSLISKLDDFIRRYYFNKLLKGIIIFLLSLLSIYLILVVVEFYFYLPVWFKVMAVSIVSIAGFWSLIRYIIYPVLQMQKLGKRINYEQAALILGKHFTDVDDKLVNILQLNKNLSTASFDTTLIEASIQQKANQLYQIPFQQAIPIAENKKYVPWLISVLAIIIGILLIAPALLKDGTKRLLQPTTAFAAPAPFEFIVEPNSLNATIWNAHKINVKLVGEKIPEEIYIIIDGQKMAMTAGADHTFTFPIKKVNAAHEFKFEAVGYYSTSYKLNINYLPIIDHITVDLIYPKHIQRSPEQLHVLNDMTVPEGTIIKWSISTKHTENVNVLLDSSTVLSTTNNTGVWTWEKQVIDDANFALIIKGSNTAPSDTFLYKISVIKDIAPQLQVEVKRDTIIGDQMIFLGQASDDRGISRLSFNYEILSNNGQVIHKKIISLPITSSLLTNINHYFDAGAIKLNENENIRMYISVCDNDIINGGKCAQSEYVYLHLKDAYSKTTTEKSELQENLEKIQESVADTRNKQKEMQRSMENLKSQMLDAKGMDWQQQQQVEQIIQDQEQLKKQVEALQKRLEEQQKQTTQQNLSQELQEQQEQVKKQVNDMLNQELKDLLNKLQELKNQRNPQQAFEQMQQLEQKNKLFQMNMERVEALIKQIELQIEMEQVAKKIDEFIAKQEEIKQNTEKGELGEEAAKKQNQLEKAFNEMVKNTSQQLSQKEKDAKSKNDVGSEMKQDAKEVSDKMNESEESLKNSQQKTAQQKQKEAIDKMKQMSKTLKDKAGGMDMEQLDIDIKATRQLLSNLLRFSFEQENLINKVKTTPTHSTIYNEIGKDQARLANNAKMIKDSLFALSKRVFQIASSVNKETTELELNLKKATQAIQDRYTPTAQVYQQHAMTNANSLALILNELLENLMSDMSEASGSGSGSSGKPQKGKGQKGEGNDGQGDGPGEQLKDIISKQQQLGKGMQQGQGQGQQAGNQQGKGQQGGEQGGQGNGQGSGNESAKGEYGDAKELARMAREQAQLRQELNKLNNILNSKGIKGLGKQMQELQQLMDKNETDLVNKRLTRELLLRQQEIMTKLLDAEKAVREQEQDDSRQGNTAKEIQRPIPPDLKDFMKQQEIIFEQYKTKAPILKPFYKKLNDDYLQKIK